MRLESLIARRYLISKHKINFITIISYLSITGISIGVGALIVVLAVFNGFSDLVTSFFTSFDPHIRIEVKNEEAYKNLGTLEEKIRNAGIETYSPFITSKVLAIRGKLNLVAEIKGIDPEQKILKLPTGALKEGEEKEGEIPAIIGKRMAKATGLRKGDYVLIRWRDKNGTFDAREGEIKEIFNCNVGTVDNNQIWIPLKRLQEMTGLENEATIIVTGKGDTPTEYEGWEFKDLTYLEREVDEIIETKKAGKTVITILLLSIALLAIFDTQVLSIFRRQKEIGTYIALGMTRNDVIKIFTVEGSMNSVLALILASLYGLPLFYYISLAGIPMPQAVDEMGVAIGEKIFPYYEAGGLIISILIVIISATIVSYLPSRKIAKLNPNEALKGKIQ